METTYEFQAMDESIRNIRRAKNLFYLLFILCLVYGGIHIYLAESALYEAQLERPEMTLRDVRFDRVEIESEKYHTLQTILGFMEIGKYILGIVTIWSVFRLMHLLDFDTTKKIVCSTGLIFPCTTLFFTIYVVNCAHRHLLKYGKYRENEDTPFGG